MKHWRTKTLTNTKRGKIVAIINISQVFNDVNYYAAYKSNGEYIGKTVDVDELNAWLHKVNPGRFVEPAYQHYPSLERFD